MTPRFENDAGLEAVLSAMRPTPTPAFVASLDERAAAGFPPAGGGFRGRLEALAGRLRSTPPRRVLAPAGALALTAIVVVVAVVANSGGGGGQTGMAAPEGGPLSAAAGSTSRPNGSSSARESAGAEYEEALPVAPNASADSTSSTAVAPSPTGPYASKAADRDVERNASIVLGAEPDGVRDAATGVFDAVHAADGIVLDSSVADGPSGRAGARFSLLIPSGKLGDALADISSVAEVRSRREATDDITAPTVSTQERLQDANATVRSALAQVAGAGTEEERTIAEAELRAARSRAASIRSSLAQLERRANFSRVSVRIVTDKSAEDEGGGGPFGVGDGIDTGARVLATVVGVTLIALAALAPFALLALLVWLCRRAWLRRSRRSTLARP